MALEELVFVGMCDLSATVRGKSVPASSMKAVTKSGVGYTPANICFSPFGTIGSSPFGTVGDIRLMPDVSTQVRLDDESLRFVLSDIVTPDGAPWAFCPRGFLRGAIEKLRIAGLKLTVGFEQEFVYNGVEAEPKRGYSLRAFHEQGAFGSRLMGALRSTGMEPDTFLPEFGPQQFEVTVAPKDALRAADEAVLLREIVRGVARSAGNRATFAPVADADGVGNGTHIHFSLRDADGDPVMKAEKRPYGLTETASKFVAGVLHHMPTLCALTTPSVASYYRLRPNKWAPTWANVSASDRAASLRVCPGSETSLNVEYRVADATANPYVALGALIHAGLDGLQRERALPAESAKSLVAMSDAERDALWMKPLPASLGAALENLRNSQEAGQWMGREFRDLYLVMKQEEIAAVDGLSPQAVCERYAAAY